jgi:hypothetical protein
MKLDDDSAMFLQIVGAFVGIDVLLVYVVAKRPSLFWRLSLTVLVLSAVINTCLTTKIEDVWHRFGVGSGIGTSFFVWVYFVLLTDSVNVCLANFVFPTN